VLTREGISAAFPIKPNWFRWDVVFDRCGASNLHITIKTATGIKYKKIWCLTGNKCSDSSMHLAQRHAALKREKEKSILHKVLNATTLSLSVSVPAFHMPQSWLTHASSLPELCRTYECRMPSRRIPHALHMPSTWLPHAFYMHSTCLPHALRILSTRTIDALTTHSRFSDMHSTCIKHALFLIADYLENRRLRRFRIKRIKRRKRRFR